MISSPDNDSSMTFPKIQNSHLFVRMRLPAAFCLMWLALLASGNADEPKIVCFYGGTADEQIGYARLRPSEIDPNMCTHLVYMSIYSTNDGDFKPPYSYDYLPDVEVRAGFQKFNALRERNEKLKTLVSSPGGMRDAAMYLELAADPSLRSKYVKNVVDFVLHNEFDGFDIDWQYPNRGGGRPEDVENFVLLLKDLRASLDQHGLILSAQVAGPEADAELYYDIPEISKYLDLILLTVNPRNIADTTTRHSAPLYPAARKTSDLDRSRNVRKKPAQISSIVDLDGFGWSSRIMQSIYVCIMNASVHYWLGQGAPAEKLILGIRFYGMGYILNNSTEYLPGSPASGPVADFDSESGYITYSEICRMISQDSWTTVWDEEQRVPYTYKGNQWISHDNVRSLTEKVGYVQTMGLGGVTASSIDMDEHLGQCGGMRYPLLSVLNRKLRGIESDSTPEASASPGAKIVCFYRSAAIEGVGYGRLNPSEIDPSLCTHLVYMFVGITEDGDVRLDSSLDLPDNGGKAGFQKFNALRKRNKKLKTLLASGDNDKEYVAYSKVLADSSLRPKYVKNVVEFVLRHDFNGFDIHWQFLKNGKGFANDMQNFVLLLKELRSSFDKHKLILSVAVRDVGMFTHPNYNISLISSQVHFISLNMEDHGFSDSTTGHKEPLYPAARETSSLERSRNINATVHYWLNHGAPAEKLILGTQFYGISYVLNNSAEHAPGSPGLESEGNSLEPGYVIDYNEICLLTAQDTWTTVWDEEQRVPYSYERNRWISYNNIRSLTEKGEYARTMGLGGVATWSIDADDHWGECGERFPLLKAVNHALRDGDSGSGLTPDTLPSTEAKIFCYYLSSAATRFDYRKLEPSAIDPSLCTHLIYASVGITQEGEVRVLDPWVDLPENKGRAGFRKFNALRKRNEKLRTILSTGGNGDGYSEFSAIAANPSLRSKYAKNVLDFLLHHEFDGFNIYWEHLNRLVVPSDVENFVLLLKELRAMFDEHKLLLSIQIDGFEGDNRDIHNIPQTSKYVDFILLATNYRKSWAWDIGHSAPLYPAARETSSIASTRNLDATVRYWLKQGMPADKLLLITRFDGVSYTLKNSADHSPGSASISSSNLYNFLQYRDYSEICRLTSQESWTTVWDEEQRVPYSYSGDQWVSYDNVKSLIEKGEYVQAMGLGGIVASRIDQDDHHGDCGQRFPLLNALNRGLRESGSSSAPEIPTPKEIADRMKSDSVWPSVEAKIVCYYRGSKKSDARFRRIEVSEIDPSLCTHLIYRWVDIIDDGEVRVVNPQYDLPDNRGKAGFRKFNALREKNKKLKTLVSSLGEVSDDDEDNDGSARRFLWVTADASLRSKYVKNIVDFVLRHEFDGFDILYRRPTMNNDGDYNTKNVVLFLKELRESFDQHKLILSLTVEGKDWWAQHYYDIPQMSKYVDFLVLRITCHEAWEHYTGHAAPLFPAARETSAFVRNANFHSAIHYWLSQGAPAQKLILGIYTFGIIYTLKDAAENVPGSAVSARPAPEFGKGYFGYRVICRLISQDGWTTEWDEEQQVPYSYAGSRWISHENNRSLTEKGKYVRAMGLGGVFVLDIDLDDPRGDCGERYPSLNALNRVLRSASDVSIDMTEDEEARKTCAKLNIKYLRHPENCARFWICYKNQNNTLSAEPFSCGNGLYFDTSNSICRSKNSVDCS